MTRSIKYFKASWCGNCRTFEPIFDSFMKNYPDVVVIKVDVDKCSEDDIKGYNITELPAIIYEDDKRSYSVHLKANKEDIERMLNEGNL